MSPDILTLVAVVLANDRPVIRDCGWETCELRSSWRASLRAISDTRFENDMMRNGDLGWLSVWVVDQGVFLFPSGDVNLDGSTVGRAT